MYKSLLIVAALLTTELATLQATTEDKCLQGVDLSTQAKKCIRKQGPRGPIGPTGPTGPGFEGPTGPTGSTGATGEPGPDATGAGGNTSYISSRLEAATQILTLGDRVIYDTVNVMNNIEYDDGFFTFPDVPFIPVGGADFQITYGFANYIADGTFQLSIVKSDATILGSGGSINFSGTSMGNIASNSYIVHVLPGETISVNVTEAGGSANLILDPNGDAPAAYITIIQVSPAG